MIEYKGKSVCGGIAIGKIHLMKKRGHPVVKHRIEDCEQEIRRFEEARIKARSQIAELHEKTAREAGEADAAIFEIHQLMLDDDNYLDSVKKIISEQKVNAEYAVEVTADGFTGMFASLDNAYIK